MKHILLTAMGGVLSILPVVATDFSYEYEGQTLNYTIIDEDARTCMTKAGYINPASSATTAGNNVSGEIMIPSVAKDGDKEYTVVSIGEYSFYKNTGLTSVLVPPSVTSIESDAFSGCSGILKAAYPETIGRDICMHYITYSPDDALIENGILYSDSNKSGILFVPISLSGHFAVPETVSSIGKYAFRGCAELTSIDIPDAVTTIGNSAFYECSGLTSVEIPNSVAEIEYGAFYSCTGLRSLDLGNSVTSIGDRAFYNCSGLASVVIPNSVTEIGSSVFEKCTGLVSVDIDFSSELKKIGSYSFSGCINLKSLLVPPSVSYIGQYAFSSCNRLKIAYPKGLYNISGYVAISYDPQKVAAENGCLYSTDKTVLYFVPSDVSGNLTIPNTVTIIGRYALNSCNKITSVEIPDKVTDIGEYSFEGCSSLTSLTIPDSVTKIWEGAFRGCMGLKSVLIGKSIKEIGILAFRDCSSLLKAAYPNTISNSPFSSKIDYDPNDSEIDNGILYGKNKTEILFVPLDLSGHFAVPETVSSIGKYAFRGCAELTS
ncbi:MAG: leucine-rich repeat domain-containing protein, partial [Muribaculaceae bacterium]|nr:leucine-rich repeat domain-containing protein [Muribaculaceae bacterium]